MCFATFFGTSSRVDLGTLHPRGIEPHPGGRTLEPPALWELCSSMFVVLFVDQFHIRFSVSPKVVIVVVC